MNNEIRSVVERVMTSFGLDELIRLDLAYDILISPSHRSLIEGSTTCGGSSGKAISVTTFYDCITSGCFSRKLNIGEQLGGLTSPPAWIRISSCLGIGDWD
ncbi:hypothetical protein BBBOND_0312570 [Babesia bigemina]|uniref:Uncharacterized protein n=1 Tax=Babesia bigemina TaxID=5866 RepID=A0A061DDF7_BABBI|nr:hypothetical protein BBBOND_0312570 [Babesia bigemina]CDR97354.1 hypothetical protein BBBOND_0312570 [Babesia bigemina]|eukprot:XP_012769540.1 hypothetical protein BBBOND_0312570 [Babesia bigemina]